MELDYLLCYYRHKTVKESRAFKYHCMDIKQQTTYAIEGSIFIGGAAIQWCRDNLNLIQHASESETLAQSVKDNTDVYFVPALTGLEHLIGIRQPVDYSLE